MISEALEREIKSYSIGEKLRALRLKKKMGLVELGKHTGLSPALISKIERDKLFPTLPTLVRISMVFGVGLEFFFAEEQKRRSVAIVRREERQKFPERPEKDPVSYIFECLDFKAVERSLNAYFAEFQPVNAEAASSHQHSGEEVLYVMSGELEIAMKGETHSLREGDAIYFDSSVPHSYRRISPGPCTGLVVTTV